jgi:hypothetical protein
MHRKTLRRGAVALALAGVLALAAARPAAASEPGPLPGNLGWLGGLFREGISGLVSFWEAATAQSETDKGFGVDPNGSSILIETPPPPDTNR